MNKVIKGLLITALTLSAQNVAAHTNKTFLQPRNQALVNLPLIDTTWSERKCAKLEDRFGGNFQITGFYGQSTDNNNTGKYFGVNNLNEFALTTGVKDANRSLVTTVDPSYLIHDYNFIAAKTVATVKLSPRVTHYGVNLAYFQDLSKIVNGLYMQVVLPINHVENNMRVTSVKGEDAAAVTNDNLAKFFAGEAVGATNALKFAKIRTGKDSATGVADIDVLLGYKLLKKEKYHLGLNIAISIPTGNEPSGEYLFDAVYGSKHFGLGGGLHAGARVWGDEDHNFKLALNANYRYMFEASEKRTAGIKGRNWSQYYGVAAATATATTPLANLTTGDFNVEPGSMVDGVINLAYNKGGFNFGLGYNLYYREAESVSMKSSWNDAQYAVVARDLNIATSAFDGTTKGRFDGDAVVFIKKADLEMPATPSQFTHSVFGGLGYAFKNWEYPLMLGLGGKYEFADKNSALEGWQGWIKAGISF